MFHSFVDTKAKEIVMTRIFYEFHCIMSWVNRVTKWPQTIEEYVSKQKANQ